MEEINRSWSIDDIYKANALLDMEDDYRIQAQKEASKK